MDFLWHVFDEKFDDKFPAFFSDKINCSRFDDKWSFQMDYLRYLEATKKTNKLIQSSQLNKYFNHVSYQTFLEICREANPIFDPNFEGSVPTQNFFLVKNM
jgi:hypothetical protein